MMLSFFSFLPSISTKFLDRPKFHCRKISWLAAVSCNRELNLLSACIRFRGSIRVWSAMALINLNKTKNCSKPGGGLQSWPKNVPLQMLLTGNCSVVDPLNQWVDTIREPKISDRPGRHASVAPSTVLLASVGSHF